MKVSKGAIFVLLGLFISACGFKPMYSSNNSAPDLNAELAQIEIGNIPNKSGQYLHNALIDKFYSDAYPQNAAYSLKVSPIQEKIIDLDITKTSDATRAQLHLKTQITLTNNDSDEIVLTRKLSSISSYNILTSEFATRVSAQNTRENALNDLANQIELQIGLYMRR